MKLSIERNSCISCGMCVSICPEVFYFSDDYKILIKEKSCEEYEKYKKDIIECKDMCPVNVIKVE